jgi:hypothetical protein
MMRCPGRFGDLGNNEQLAYVVVVGDEAEVVEG